MVQVKLHTYDEREVTTVTTPPFIIPPEGVIWGQRCFFLRPNGKYCEGLLYPIIDWTYVTTTEDGLMGSPLVQQYLKGDVPPKHALDPGSGEPVLQRYIIRTGGLTPLYESVPRVEAFIDEVASLCNRYGMMLEHEDSQGAFIIGRLDPEVMSVTLGEAMVREELLHVPEEEGGSSVD